MNTRVVPRLWAGQKPSAGIRVDPDHPFGSRLVYCLPLNEGAGNQVMNAAGGFGWEGTRSGFLAGTGALTWKGGPRGTVLDFSGATYLNAGRPEQYYKSSDTQATMIAIFQSTSATAAMRIISHVRAGAAFTSHCLGKGLSGTGHKAGIVYRAVGDSSVILEGTSSLNDGKLYHICGVINGPNAYVYVNGIREATSATTVGQIPTFDNSGLSSDIGSFNRGASQIFVGQLEGIWYYRNRAFSDAEVMEHYRNPYGMFLPLRFSHSARAVAAGAARFRRSLGQRTGSRGAQWS